MQCVFVIGKYFTVFTMLDSKGIFLPYSRVTSRESGLMTMMQMICTDCDGKIPVFIRSGYEKQF